QRCWHSSCLNGCCSPGRNCYHEGMAMFMAARVGLRDEASIADQKCNDTLFSYLMYPVELIRIFTLMLASTVVVLAFGGGAAVRLQPDLGPSGFKSRALSRSDGGVRVSTSVLSADESLALYGVPLAKKGIQPVWIEVENHDAIAYWLMSPGLDPHFFPASEAADGFAAGRRDE